MKNLFTYLFFISSFFLNAQETVEDDFEGNGTITSWEGDDCGIDTAFTNPFQTGINTSNTVLKYTDSGGNYANVRFDTPINFDLSINHTFSLKIYVPASSITGNETNQLSLKLQNGNIGSVWETQTEIIKTLVLDQWQTITFDFENDNYLNYNSGSGAPTERTDFNRVLIQVNSEDNTNNVTAYIDDFLYDGVLEDNSGTGSGNDPIYDELIWSDEFDGTGAIDSNKWFHQTQLPSGGSWYNGEIQHYTNRTTNTYVSNGAMHLVAKKEAFTDQGQTKQYTSARLNSKIAFTYGKVEVRAILPTGVGTWPAIWMLGKNITETGAYWQTQGYGTTSWPACGEVDIMEHWGTNQNFVQSAMHTPSSSGGTVNHGGQTISTASTAYHVYSLEWYPEKMVFKVDGVHHYTYQPEVRNSSTWPFDADQYILLNTAIQPSITSSFTQSDMIIDYVRVYQEATASVNEVANLDAIKIYPNPVENNVTIQIQPNLIGVKATVYSLLGKEITSFVQNTSTEEYDLSKLKKGVYILKFDSKGLSSTYKILKM